MTLFPHFVPCAEDSAHYSSLSKTSVLRAVGGTFERLVSQFAGDDFL